jgi:CMP-N-acetylneuraminic acid synthetase
MFAADSVAVALPRHRVCDIDTPEDWTRAELMHAALVASGEIDKLF